MRPSLLASLAICAGCSYPEFHFAEADASVDAASDVAAQDTPIADVEVEDVANDADAPAAEDVSDGDAASDADASETCGAGEQLCGTTCVDTRTDRANCGGCAKPCGRGQQCVASVCKPEPSCKAIKAKLPAETSGEYTIDPDGDGPLSPFDVFCEMSADGGGWTLALKLDGARTTFAYDAALWTNDALLNTTSTDLSFTEAKFRSFVELPFTQVRVRMHDGKTSRFFPLNLAGTSLRALFSGGAVATTAGRTKWLSLVPDPSLQANCNAEGVNQEYVAGIRVKLRIGIVGNEQADCGTPDSYLGFGATIGATTVCFGGTDPGVVVGNLARLDCGAPKDVTAKLWGFLFVR